MKELVLDASMDNFDEAMGFVEEAFEELDCPMKAAMQFSLAADEIYSNVCFYAYKDMEPTDHPLFGKVVLKVGEMPGGCRMGALIIEDAGRPYDPLSREDPDTTLSAEERDIGGLGIFMVKKSMDDMRYEYVDGKNVLTMIKKI